MRLIQALYAAQKADKLAPLRKWAYYASGFHKYGLKRHDVLYETDDVVEALRRMPEELVDERNFRMRRAIQFSCNKMYAPKELWTKYEEDDLYMQPYLDEVVREREEREKWDKK